MFKCSRRVLAASAGLVLALGFTPVLAADAAPPTPANAAPTTAKKVKIPEGTEFPLRLEETISSKTASEGDRFAVSLNDDVKLPDGTVLHAGYRGVGEIVDAHGNGMLGKTGKLGIRVSYLKIGDQRIKLRAVKSSQGDHSTAAQVVTVLLFWPVAPFIKGHETKITKGTPMTGYTDQDIELDGPLPSPPPEG